MGAYRIPWRPAFSSHLINALVLTGLANFRMVDKPGVIALWLELRS
jgi:hypothetical protein